MQNANIYQRRREKSGLFTEQKVHVSIAFFFCDRVVRGGLWSPRLVHRWCVPLRGRLDGTGMWAEGLSPTLHRPRSLPRGQVWLPSGLDGWTLHHRWATMTRTALHAYTYLTEGHELQGIHLRTGLKGQLWFRNVSIFPCSFRHLLERQRSWHNSVAAHLLQTSTFAWHTSDG